MSDGTQDFRFLPASYGVSWSDPRASPSFQDPQEGPLLAPPQAKDATLARHRSRREGKQARVAALLSVPTGVPESVHTGVKDYGTGPLSSSG